MAEDDTWQKAFGEKWDAIVLGTGLKECLLSGLLSVAGKKVLHLDRNPYYGGASASLDVTQFFDKMGSSEKPVEAELGKLRDYSIDLIPKFLMAGGNLVKVLIHTGVSNYIEFKPVDGSFVYSNKAGKVCKVPATPEDAMKSSLMSMMEKTRMMQFTLWVSKVQLADRKTWVAGTMTKKKLELDTMTGKEFFKYWALEQATIDFLTHACCLYLDESYTELPAIEIVKKMQLYLESKTRFAGMTSPFLYPLYGLGELPQAFARLAAVHGGTYMLNHAMGDEGPVFGEGKFEVQYEAGVATGIKVMDTVANASVVIGDPSYFPTLVKKQGAVVRCIAIVNAPLASTNLGSEPAGSYQVIFPGSTIGRKNDLYLFCCSSPHKVAPAGKYIIFCSTIIEGPATGACEGIAQRELAAGLELISAASPAKMFYDMYDLMVPVEAGSQSKVYISESYDATSHFETTITDVLAMYERIVGEKLILTSGPGSSE
jgi:Rab GDP dissociation inhibitor